MLEDRRIAAIALGGRGPAGMHVPVAEAGREREFDEDSGITWVDFTDVIRNASAGKPDAPGCRRLAPVPEMFVRALLRARRKIAPAFTLPLLAALRIAALLTQSLPWPRAGEGGHVARGLVQPW